MLLKPQEDSVKPSFRVLRYLLLPKGQHAVEIPCLWLLDKFILFRCSYNRFWSRVDFNRVLTLLDLLTAGLFPCWSLCLEIIYILKMLNAPFDIYDVFPQAIYGLYLYMAIGGTLFARYCSNLCCSDINIFRINYFV